MVNFSNAFALPNKSSIFANRDTNLMPSRFYLSKMETCESISEPYPMFEQEPLRPEVDEVQSQREVQPKPSPSYMDDDAQFNFPDYQLQNGTKFNSHVMAENRGQPVPVPNVLSDSFPTFERQYSINTVMEVIECHDINDLSSSGFTATNPHEELSSYTQTKPMNIQRNINNGQKLSSSSSFGPSDHLQKTVLAPPASDLSDCNQENSISSSPVHFPFTCYQDDFNQASPSNTTITQQSTFSTTSQNQLTYDEASTVVPMHPTEDQLSPFSPVFSPYSCEMQSPALLQSANDEQSARNTQIFNFDNYTQHFTPSQSSSTFNYSNQQQYVSSPTPVVSVNNIPCLPQHHHQAPPPYDVSVTTGFSSNINTTTSSSQFQLEEVDQTVVTEDLRSLSRTSITEQEKADLKRIRNNKACRASRERRKKRKADKEALADKLLDENHQLKETVRQLEKELTSVHEDVRRAIYQTYPDHDLPSVFKTFDLM